MDGKGARKPEPGGREREEEVRKSQEKSERVANRQTGCGVRWMDG